jgi:DNA-binding MarR family transcriptional regulator
MTAAQMNLLVLVSNHGPIGQAEISRQLNLEKSTLSRNVERMRTQGWIVTSPSGAGRGRVLDLTAAGVKQLETSRPLWDAAQVEARGLLGERDARSLKRIADSLWATLGQN